jgi:hypothetical protein
MVAGVTRSHDEIAQGLMGMAVTAKFFDVLRVRRLVGRTLIPGEDRIGVEAKTKSDFRIYVNPTILSCPATQPSSAA